MNVLLIYPRGPATFWGAEHALGFIGAKAAFPPAGLLTVAAMLPASCDAELIDLNVKPLLEEHLKWADLAMVSAMHIQADSAREVIARCRQAGLPVAAGGPFFTVCPDDDHLIDHVFRGEAEDTLRRFIEDLRQGRAGHIYRSEKPPDLGGSPPPRWDLIDFRDYSTMIVQASRGCPHDCDFCGITTMYGRRQRYKSPAQVCDELHLLHRAGWRGNVFFVDDNFIGHPGKAREVLQAVVAWQKRVGFPFFFLTQTTLDLAEDQALMSLMAEANFRQVFIGIETTSQEALRECRKGHNLGLDPVEAVRTIQHNGMEVTAGLIVGFDSEPESIFQDHEDLMVRAGIPTAMIGLLTAIPGTRFHERMARQGRLLGESRGDQFEPDSLNFATRRDRAQLLDEYLALATRLYKPEAFLERALCFNAALRKPYKIPSRPPSPREIAGGIKVLWRLGFRSRWRGVFWSFLLRVLHRHPSRLPWALEFAVYAHHYHEYTRGLAGQRAMG